MRCLIIIAVILFNTSLGIFAQNYQTVNSGRIQYFGRLEPYVRFPIKAAKVDSVKYDKDSILYLNNNIHKIHENCYTPYGASLLGSKIKIDKDCRNIFYNKFGHEIVIDTKAGLNDSWEFIYAEDSTNGYAEVTEIKEMDFLGFTDTVKVIEAHVENEIDSKEYNFEIILGKNLGLIQTVDMFNLPFYKNIYENNVDIHYQLKGISSPRLGSNDMTWLEVNDFYPGDEIHIHYNYWEVRDTSIYKYIDRVDYKDSVKYTYTKESLRRISNSDGHVDIEYSLDTLEKTFYPDINFDKPVGQPIIYGNFMSLYSLGDAQDDEKFEYNHPYIYYRRQDSCWELKHSEGYGFSKYVRGLGGPYYRLYIEPVEKLRKILYFKKRDTTWGEPVVITAKEDVPATDEILVYPNPCSDYLVFRNTQNNFGLKFELFDMNGVKIFFSAIKQNTGIQLPVLSNGVYLYRISNSFRILKSDKLVIIRD